MKSASGTSPFARTAIPSSTPAIKRAIGMIWRYACSGNNASIAAANAADIGKSVMATWL